MLFWAGDSCMGHRNIYISLEKRYLTDNMTTSPSTREKALIKMRLSLWRRKGWCKTSGSWAIRVLLTQPWYNSFSPWTCQCYFLVSLWSYLQRRVFWEVFLSCGHSMGQKARLFMAGVLPPFLHHFHRSNLQPTMVASDSKSPWSLPLFSTKAHLAKPIFALGDKGRPVSIWRAWRNVLSLIVARKDLRMHLSPELSFFQSKSQRRLENLRTGGACNGTSLFVSHS